jgi:hypothetical protein
VWQCAKGYGRIYGTRECKRCPPGGAWLAAIASFLLFLVIVVVHLHLALISSYTFVRRPKPGEGEKGLTKKERREKRAAEELRQRASLSAFVKVMANFFQVRSAARLWTKPCDDSNRMLVLGEEPRRGSR